MPTVATSPVHDAAVCGCVGVWVCGCFDDLWSIARMDLCTNFLRYPPESSTKGAPPPTQVPPDLMKIALSRRTGVVLDNVPIIQALGRSSPGRTLRIIVDHKSASSFKVATPGEHHLGGETHEIHKTTSVPRAPSSLLNTKSVGVLPYLIHPGTSYGLTAEGPSFYSLLYNHSRPQLLLGSVLR